MKNLFIEIGRSLKNLFLMWYNRSMIVGMGIDNIELSRITTAMLRSDRFIKKLLTTKELSKANQLNGQQLIEFVAGRWAAKEAFGKAYGIGIETKGLGFQDLEVIYDLNGRPYFSHAPFQGNVQLSISHSKTEAVAVVVLEEK